MSAVTMVKYMVKCTSVDFYDCPNNGSHPGWPETTEVYSLTVIVAQSKNRGVIRATRLLKVPGRVLPCFFELLGAPHVFLAHPTPG